LSSLSLFLFFSLSLPFCGALASFGAVGFEVEGAFETLHDGLDAESEGGLGAAPVEAVYMSRVWVMEVTSFCGKHA